MTKTIQCDIVSAHEEIFSGEATMVIASGIAGELGIAPRHAPLITQLKAGPVRVQQADGEEEFFFVSGGILEVQPHLITVLTDTATRGQDLDEAAARAAKAEAERQLADRTGEMEVAEAQAQLMQAAAQLAALEHLRKKLKR
jgi:F-type H+-transporting ATPase subunit epsilon